MSVTVHNVMETFDDDVQPFTSVPITVYVAFDVGKKATPSTMPLVHEYVVAPLPVKVRVGLSCFVAAT